MAITIHNVKGRDLPPSWRKQANADPEELLQITIELESEAGDGLMPPEEDFRPEFIAEVEQSGKEYREGKGIKLQNSQEIDEFFKKIRSE
jgi:hypothetical protein